MQPQLPHSCLTLVTLWTVAYQARLSMGFSRQEYRSALPCPPPGNLPNPETFPTPGLLHCRIAGGFFTYRATWEAQQLKPGQLGLVPREESDLTDPTLHSQMLMVESWS